MNRVGPQLLERLLDEHGAALVLYARQWCDLPNDVVQEALLRLVRQHPPPENVVGWLYRVVRNGAITAARKAERRRRHEAAAARRNEPWFAAPLGQRLDAAVATEALNQLPIQQRQIVVARIWGGLSFGQIAELTGFSPSTAARRYQEALKVLRERLKVECPTNKNSRPS